MPIGLNDGMAPKVRTTLACLRLGVSNIFTKIQQLAFTQKFTKGQSGGTTKKASARTGHGCKTSGLVCAAVFVLALMTA